VNVKIKEITNANAKKNYIPKQQNKGGNFRKILDSNESSSKKFSKDQNLNKAGSEISDKGINKSQSEDVEKTPKGLKNNNKSTEEMTQSEQILQSLRAIIQRVEDRATNDTSKDSLNPINLEQLIDGEKLTPDTKSLLKNNISEIVALLKKTKDDKEATPQLLDLLQKLPTQVEGKNTMHLDNSNDSNKLKTKIIDFVEIAIDALKQNTEKPSEQSIGTDKSTEKVAQVQQVLESLSSILQSVEKTTTTNNGKNQLNSINLEKLVGVEKLTPEIKNMLKNNLNGIVAMIEKSKDNNGVSTQIIDVLQKLTTEVESSKVDLKLLKVLNFQTFTLNNEEKSVKDNLLTKQSIKTTDLIVPINQMQTSNDTGQGSKFSGNSSFEEKFLNNLLMQDKDETKISKAVNFMNQFEVVKIADTTKVQAANMTISKNNFEVDVIKTIKFMEINNIKDLVVKMNPKELGEITIKLTMESGIIKANISAQNKDTYNLINNNFQDISDKLKNMDIKIHSLNINIYEDSTFFSKDSNGKNTDGRQNNNLKANMVSDEEDISITNNYVIENNQVNKFV